MNQIADDKIMYIWFDFHHECRKMKYENLSKLVDLMKDRMNSFNSFMVTLEFGMDNREKITS